MVPRGNAFRDAPASRRHWSQDVGIFDDDSAMDRRELHFHGFHGNESDGRVMDGMHRVCKALLEGRETIAALQFELDPEPDFRDVQPDDLPY